MMASVPAYVEYAETVLMPKMDPAVLAEIKAIEKAKDYDNPRYMELLLPNYYTQHILRMPLEQWPDPVNRSFARLNKDVYIPMQGPSEMSASGKLEHWDRLADLGKLTVPVLTIGGQYDTMDPRHMEKMAEARWQGTISLLRQWLPFGDVRRSGNVFRGLSQVH